MNTSPGEIFAMSGASPRHNVIALNLAAAFHAHLGGGPCRAFIADVKLRLRVGYDEIFYYPDVWVACGELPVDDRYVRDATLIVEVLSPSTASIDRREKALNYRRISSLKEYVLVAQDALDVTIYRSCEDWRPQRLGAPEEVAEFRSIGLSLPLTQVYRGVLACG
jgi:Uma2 family endonuclease